MANSDYKTSQGGGFAPRATLNNEIFEMDQVVRFYALTEPYVGAIEPGMGIMIDAEIMVIVSIAREQHSMQVLRGCADTIPAKHRPGAHIWVIGDFAETNFQAYSGGEQVAVKVLPYIPMNGTLATPRAEPLPLSFDFRFARPYPPGQMRINTARWYLGTHLSTDNPAINLTYVHRNRVLQADRLVSHDEANVNPEPGQTYTLRVYNASNTLVRTETGYTGQLVTYGWWQALYDLGLSPELVGSTYSGFLEFESRRDGFPSWQFYRMPFTVNNTAEHLYVTAVGQSTAQEDTLQPLTDSLALARVGMSAAQTDDFKLTDALVVSRMAEAIGQPTSFYANVGRFLSEAPYTLLAKKGLPASANRIMTMAIRPADRMTDNHWVYGQETMVHPMVKQDYPPFTPWAVAIEPLAMLATTVRIGATSAADGVSLESVRPGQMALVTGEIRQGDVLVATTHEIVRVVSVESGRVNFARGCVDTVPAAHPFESRIWFFEAACGLNSPTQSYSKGELVATKIVPAVYGPDLDPATVPSQYVRIAERAFRPFPPGNVRVNGLMWFQGARVSPDSDVTITWNQRNRLAQGTNVLDHYAPAIQHEPGTTYRIRIALRVRNNAGIWVERTISIYDVQGSSFTYTYALALADAGRVRTIVKACGWVVVPMYLEAVRDGLVSWQGYSLPITLPAPVCTIGQTPGGGQTPWPTWPGTGGGGSSGGNGNDGGYVPSPSPGPTKPPVNPPLPPVIPPPPPPDWPPVPPLPIEPTDPGEPNPGDTDPDEDEEEGIPGEHWDFTWDIHWDAFRRHTGNDEGEG